MPRPDMSGDRPGTRAAGNERRLRARPRKHPSPVPRAGAAGHVRGAAVTGPANAERAAWAGQAIEAFQSASGHHGELDTVEAIGGLITALCHYTDRHGI